MSRLSLTIFLLLLSASVAVQGPSPEGPESADGSGGQPDGPPVADAGAGDRNNAVIAPRIIVSSVLGFIIAMVIAATAFFMHKKKAATPLDAMLVRLFGGKGRTESERRESNIEEQQVARPPDVALSPSGSQAT